MTQIYNQYLRPGRSHNYVSEIAFINTSNPIIARKLYYIECHENSPIKSGYYMDNNENYLQKKYRSFKYNTKLEDKHIKTIHYMEKYFTYIKIITDYNNPQLEGNIMIFTFTNRILNMVVDFLKNKKTFDKTFNIIVGSTHGFPNYDACHFTNNDLTISDSQLNLESEINYKQFDIKSIERREKLKKITNDINEIEEWICE